MKNSFTTLIAALALLIAAGCDGSGGSGLTPDVASDVRLDVPADVAADLAPDAPTPDATPDAAPDAAPDTTPDAAPDTTPDAAPDATPDAAPDAAPDATPDAAPDTAPDTTPDTAPDTTPDTAPDTTPDVEPPPTCTTWGFASTPTTWTLPYPLLTTTGSDYNQLANAQHALLDLDGDGDQDFLVFRDTERTQPDPLVGKSYWLLFPNTGSGFATSPTPWTLPYPLKPVTGGDFNQLANSNHALVDMDGDGRVDFVQLADEGTQTDPLLGKNHWRVYLNTGAGFAPTPTLWTLPFPLDSNSGDFNQLANASHLLFSLDGDKAPDFVVISDDERSASDPLVGKNHWLVFPNTGAGFATQPTAWALPYPLLPPQGGDFNAIATFGHTLLDLAGSGRADFVVHRDVERDSSDPLVGKNHWLVFPNTTTGFSGAPTPWGLPFPLLGGGLDGSDAANAHHALLSLTGAAAPDFLVIRDTERAQADPLVGKSYWLAFPNTGAGFDPTPRTVALPYPLLTADGQDFNHLATQRHALVDLDADGRLDFVELATGESSESDPLAGKSYWRIYNNLCP